MGTRRVAAACAYARVRASAGEGVREAAKNKEKKKSITFQAAPPSPRVGQSRAARDIRPEVALRVRCVVGDNDARLTGGGGFGGGATDAVTTMTDDLARVYAAAAAAR